MFSTQNIFSVALIVFAGLVLITYQYDLNLAPEFHLYFIQMILLWCALKIIYLLLPKCKMLVLVALLIWGVVEAVWGLGQLYGYFPTKHTLFKTTGSFFNPGPYGGFIAMVIPINLHLWLSYKRKKKWLSYVFFVAGMVCLLVLPATLSRTAWIAAIIGCILVLLGEKRIIIKMRDYWKRYKKRHTLFIFGLCLFTALSVYGIYHLKKDSADGRLFMWKITTLAILEAPLKGTGLGGFPSSYADAQISFFKSGKATTTEMQVAGSPEYAFNEYLQVFLEQGPVGFLLFLLLTFLIIKSGIKNKQRGAAGGFLTLSVFAFASYPYQLWQFPIAWVILGTVCTSNSVNFNTHSSHQSWKTVVPFLVILGGLVYGSISLASSHKVYRDAREEWKRLQPLYNMKSYESVAESYATLYRILNYEPKFVFEHGVILNAMGKLEEANRVLARGIEKSCDPMFLNVRGRNYHEMGNYHKAEQCFHNSLLLLPGRVYPYYLLVKLYADPAYHQPDKMQETARIALKMEPKIYSMAIEEMRNEIRKIMHEKEGEREEL